MLEAMDVSDSSLEFLSANGFQAPEIEKEVKHSAVFKEFDDAIQGNDDWREQAG